MWAFIFIIFLGIFLFNTILIHEKESQGFSLSNTLNEAKGKEEINQTKEVNSTKKAFDKSLVDKIILFAKSKIGNPYIYADTGPDSFDCSGFVYYLFKEQNISISRTSLEQSKEGNPISREEIQRGDRIFFDTSHKGHVNHVGIYLGEGKFIHASSGKAKGVTISDLNAWYKDKFLWGIHTKEDNLSNPLQDLTDQKPSKSPQDIP